eukprot:SAG22_NODE_2534_length_2468_cov_1.522161_2_plen_52_part_00
MEEAACIVVAGAPAGATDLLIVEEALAACNFDKDVNGVWAVKGGPACDMER